MGEKLQAVTIEIEEGAFYEPLASYDTAEQAELMAGGWNKLVGDRVMGTYASLRCLSESLDIKKHHAL